MKRFLPGTLVIVAVLTAFNIADAAPPKFGLKQGEVWILDERDGQLTNTGGQCRSYAVSPSGKYIAYDWLTGYANRVADDDNAQDVRKDPLYAIGILEVSGRKVKLVRTLVAGRESPGQSDSVTINGWESDNVLHFFGSNGLEAISFYQDVQKNKTFYPGTSEGPINRNEVLGF
jgi:hypothetical protein